MLNAARAVALRTRSATVLAHSSSSALRSSFPNAPLNLDGSLEDLLRNSGISLKNGQQATTHKELEVVPKPLQQELQIVSETSSPDDPLSSDTFADESSDSSHRKSPAALFGSQQLGEVVLPEELQDAIISLISDTNKPRLHSDAKRLYQANPGEETPRWDLQHEVRYSSRRQADRHAIRDGTAFASVALPAHFSAVTAVLNHIRLRQGRDFQITRLVDWGAGAGSALWASMYAFQSESPLEPRDASIANTSIGSYVGIDKREGLVSIAKRLLSKITTTPPDVVWQKSFTEKDRFSHDDGRSILALSAFTLSTLPSPLAQKELVREIWKSGAHTIVLIDHKSKDGFEAVARAREYMLDAGRREAEDPECVARAERGCHVVAPCPHDRACPLLDTVGDLVCGFSQRIQRPSFVRLTKHSPVGHEDIEYSYVVIRRGPRPAHPNTTVGRVGTVGRRETERLLLKQTPMKELSVHAGGHHVYTESTSEVELDVAAVEEEHNPEILDEQLRQEAYHWPRLVFPPLKKPGHIILDSCTPDGKIMRLTVPKSQGKQPFYDARKSSWGDLFPHPPKNKPIERCQFKSQKMGQPMKSGGDIGKRRTTHKDKAKADKAAVMDRLREKKLSRRDFARTRVDKAWQD